MGNTCVNPMRKTSSPENTSRSGLLVLFQKKNTEQTISNDNAKPNKLYKIEESHKNVDIYNIARCRQRQPATFDEDTMEAAPNPVEFGVVFQIPRSRVIVNPYNFNTDDDYRRIQVTVRGMDDEDPMKDIQKLFSSDYEPNDIETKAKT